MPVPPFQFELRQLVRAVERVLADAGREEARTMAEWLVATAAGIGRLDLLIQAERLLDAESLARLDGWVARAARGEPLQYVVGNAPFLGRDFRCDPRALIPRPETEDLCARVLAAIPAHAEVRIADVGTGTGCIAITIALDRPSAHVMAIDVSPDALALARENARAFGVEERIEWRQTDLLAGVSAGALDAIVSNPPYVADGEWARLDSAVRDFEPRLALAAGADGLDVIRRLADQARQTLVSGGRLWMEIGNEQGPAVRDLLLTHGFIDVAIRRDCAGHERIAEARSPNV